MDTWTLDIRDELFSLRHPETDSEFTASTFYIVATSADGRRFAHERRFPSAHVVVTDDHMGIASYRDEAMERAAALLERMLMVQRSGNWSGPNPHWHEVEPVYGSFAYLRTREVR